VLDKDRDDMPQRSGNPATLNLRHTKPEFHGLGGKRGFVLPGLAALGVRLLMAKMSN